ncbi:unnamed protein product [Larinioides sclopetarius]|uniref:Dolichyl-phosphate beta-glucosyltransferase n=1 Tax=Larinioides sclopetarius TaxID=280406 RepID=A0AAV2B9Y2_9ARAC
MLSARGKLLLFADADGATKFSDIEKLEEEINVLSGSQIDAVVIGSRAHLDKEAIASRSLFRTILMYAFHFMVWLLAVRTVQDTQYGFKMFTREAASSLFYVLHVERWAFDVELLYIAEKKKIPVKEVAVNWTEIEGSKQKQKSFRLRCQKLDHCFVILTHQDPMDVTVVYAWSRHMNIITES